MSNFNDDYFDDEFFDDEDFNDEGLNYNEDGEEYLTVHEKIGYKYFPPAELLDKEHLLAEYQSLLDTLEEKNINVHFLHIYPIEERYRFITEELFNFEIDDEDYTEGSLNLDYIYEEYHDDIDYFNSCFLK